MDRRTLVAAAAAIVLCCMARLASGQGGPPLLTDDPGTPGPGRWEVNTAITVDRTRHEWLWETPILDINYGVGERIQLKYEAPLLILDPENAGPIGGLGNSVAGVKYRFMDEEKSGLAMSVYPQVEFNNPTDAVDRGLVESGTNVLLPIQMAKAFEKLEVDVEVGYELVQDAEDQWIHGLALGYPVTRRVDLLAELFGTVDQEFRHEALILNLGSRVELSGHMKLLFSVGRGIIGATEDKPTLLMYAGVQFTF